MSLIGITMTGCLEFFPFRPESVLTLVTTLVHSVFSNLVCCIVYFSILTPCIYEKILSPILLYILKPTKQRQLSPSDIFLFKFIVNLTQN